MTRSAFVLLASLGTTLSVSCKDPVATPAPTTTTKPSATNASTTTQGTETPVTKKDPAPQPASIGEATMEPDGTIVLQLRAVGPGVIGDGLLKYPPKHAQYESVKKHLGGLKPGEHKPVPPFP